MGSSKGLPLIIPRKATVTEKSFQKCLIESTKGKGLSSGKMALAVDNATQAEIQWVIQVRQKRGAPCLNTVSIMIQEI